MKHYRVYVTFSPEETQATHYLTVDDIAIRVATKDGSITTATAEVHQFLDTHYPDRQVERVSVSRI